MAIKRTIPKRTQIQRAGRDDDFLNRFYIINVGPKHRLEFGERLLMQIPVGESIPLTTKVDRNHPHKSTSHNIRRKARFLHLRTRSIHEHLNLDDSIFVKAFPEIEPEVVLVTELFGGEDLATYVNRTKSRALAAGGSELFDYISTILTMGRRVAEGLGEFHNLPKDGKLVYRNVRPQKILLKSRTVGYGLNPDNVKLEDLSRACTEGPLPFNLRYVKDLDYDAPETVQREAHAVPASDVYSLGVVLRNALTFNGTTRSEILKGKDPAYNRFPAAMFALELTKDMMDINHGCRPNIGETVSELDECINMHIAENPRYIRK